jgi:putative ABC transport system permease protein
MFEDLRAIPRLFRTRPTFAASVVATLALSIAAITAVFTVADPMLFRPLPYPDADRIVRVRATGGGIPGGFLPSSDYAKVLASHDGFADVCDFEVDASGRLEGTDEEVFAYSVSQGFFDVFGIRLGRGRPFDETEFRSARASGSNVTPSLITHGMWKTAFGRRTDILGHVFRVTSRPPKAFVIVGVLPEEFVFPEIVNAAPTFLTPAPPLAADDLVDFVARLKPGVSVIAATAQLQAILDGEPGARRRARLTPIQDALLGSTKTPLWMLLIATAGLLLVACVNLTYLFSAHLEARRAELSVRVAIGAGKWRLMRQLWIEASALALLAGMVALPLSQWLVRQIMERLPVYSHEYRLVPATVNVRVILFATCIALVASFIYGLLPAFQALRVDVRSALAGERAASSARAGKSTWLIATQTMLAVAILVAGGLVMRSFLHLISQSLGFDPFSVRTVFVASRGSAEDDTSKTMIERYQHLRQRFPSAVSLAAGIPGFTFATTADVAGRAEPDRLFAFDVSGTFFDVFRLHLRRGRLFSDEEALSNAPVAVVDERAAQTLWPGQDPLGQQIVDGRGFTRSVIGVVDTVIMRLVPGGDVRSGTAYIPISPKVRFLGMSVSENPSVTLDAFRDAAHEVAPGAYVNLRPLQPFERTLGQPRFLATMLGWLSVLTLVLTGIGIAGVAHHESIRRTREIGIRLALGAEPRAVQRWMLRRSLVPSLIGISLGVGISIWGTPALESLLFGITPHDVSTIAAIAMSVLALVLLASWGPVRRASRQSPTVALRSN